jgi:4-amino-4-deoxy-L-arabinose transferase-like glycosyltransferase
MNDKSRNLIMQSRIEKIIRKLKTNYIPLMLFSAALILRSLALNVPYSKFDEYLFIDIARHILENPLNPLSPNPEIWTCTHGPVFPYLSAFCMYLFDDPYLSTRVLVAIIGSLSVIVTYFFAKRLFGKTIGAMTGLLMVFTPEHWSYSMQAITDIPFFLFFLCSLYFIYVGIEDNRNGMLLLGGVLAGLSALTSYTGLMIIPIFFFYLLLTGRIGYFARKKVFSSIVIIPSLMTLWWIAYMLTNPGSIANPYGLSAYLTLDSSVPRYQILSNISIILLLCVFPLAFFPYIHIFKKYFSSKYLLCPLIIFYLITILILKLLLPDDIPVYGANVLWTVESILNHLHPALFNLAKLIIYLLSILALVGFFVETYMGAKDKRNEYTLLACWVAIIFTFALALTVSYTRYLLPVVPAFFMVVSLEMETLLKKGKRYKQILYIAFIAFILVFLTVGLLKVFFF